MDSTSRRILLSCGVLTLAICLCASLVSIGYAAIIFWNLDMPGLSPAPETLAPTESLSPTVTPGTIVTPDTSPSAPTLPASPVPQSDLPPATVEQMEKIQEQVSELRGLQPQDSVERAILSPEGLRQRVTDDFLKDYSPEEADDDALVLAAFGLVEPTFDLYDFYLELYSEQVAGFYDSETGEMYVVQGESFRAPQRLTYAHEFVHALQDQHYDIENGLNYNEDACELDSERCAAVLALLEGDASLVELEWFTTYATPQDYAELQDFYSNYQSPVFDSAPSFMREDFLFPYISGQAFVEHLVAAGGWEAVDNAYRNLPVSTKQILHPERYPDDVPTPVEIPDLLAILGDGWRELDRGVMGEWYTYLILAHGLESSARLADAQAQSAAEGWAGDTYMVYFHDESGATTMVLKTAWENQSEAAQFGEAFQQYASARFGSPLSSEAGKSVWSAADGYVEFVEDGATTTWLLAPDQETGAAVLNLIE